MPLPDLAKVVISRNRFPSVRRGSGFGFTQWIELAWQLDHEGLRFHRPPRAIGPIDLKCDIDIWVQDLVGSWAAHPARGDYVSGCIVRRTGPLRLVQVAVCCLIYHANALPGATFNVPRDAQSEVVFAQFRVTRTALLGSRAWLRDPPSPCPREVMKSRGRIQSGWWRFRHDFKAFNHN
ncbi:uncharacterized protein LY89DRAFT_669594 [Mollisia scopiformis]|uniref:Uncharacterized protein n=1 Tax=Mollisia scopiformis TaxID=149040 RepID=A0A194XAL8_MOLSC|nr:uncharacterized protein LY89DRAFT_669594 [Mollisia scopiformis]KUJ17184.1 hypothetical protein LY89DRAFT_669594 [Mollisia scopiformis]